MKICTHTYEDEDAYEDALRIELNRKIRVFKGGYRIKKKGFSSILTTTKSE